MSDTEKVTTPSAEDAIDYVTQLEPGDVLGAIDDGKVPVRRSLLILLLSVVVAGLVFVVTAVYFIYVFAVHLWTWDSRTRTITTAAPAGSVSTILMVISHVVNFSVAIGAALHVYTICAMWVKTNRRNDGGEHVERADISTARASAAELDMLVSLLKSGGPVTWFRTAFRLSTAKGDRRRRLRASPTYPLLVNALLVVGGLLALSYASTIFQVWLNDSTYPAFTNVESTLAVGKDTNFSRQVNQALCDQSRAQSNAWGSAYAYMSTLCGLQSGPVDLNPGESDDRFLTFSAVEGSRVLSNSSLDNQAAYTNDQHAILVEPYSDDLGDSYTGTTIGVHSTCRSITQQCVSPDNYNDLPNWNCSASLNVNLEYSTTLGIINPHNGSVGSEIGPGSAYFLVDSNVFRVAAVPTSYAYSPDSPDDDQFDEVTGFVWNGAKGLGYNALLCEVIVHDVYYDFDEAALNDISSTGRFKTLNVSNSSIETTQRVVSVLDASFLYTGIPERVDGMGFESGNQDTYVAAFALELSRELVAYVAAIYEAVPALSVTAVDQQLGASIPLVPMLLYFLTVVCYGCFTLWIGIRAYLATVGNADVQRTHMRLTQPLTSLQALYEAGNAGQPQLEASKHRKHKGAVTHLTGLARSEYGRELLDYVTGAV